MDKNQLSCLSVKFRPNIGQISVKYRSNIGQISVKYRSNIGQISIRYRPSNSKISVKTKLTICFSGLDERGLEGQQMLGGPYGHRSNSSASSSPPATSGSGQTGLVVPQPINAAKSGQNPHGNQQGNNNSAGHIHTHPSNGASGRKYQCKMCPQVGKVGHFLWFFALFRRKYWGRSKASRL